MQSSIFIVYYKSIRVAKVAALEHRSKLSMENCLLINIETPHNSAHHQGCCIANEPYYHSVKCVNTSQYNNIIARI